MDRRNFLKKSGWAALAAAIAPIAELSAARRRTHGTVIVQVYREPRRGRREKLPGIQVALIHAVTRRRIARTVTNRYGVARFNNVPVGPYYATSTVGASKRGNLRGAVLRLAIAR